MSNRGIDAPLAVQMDRLKKHMQKRDKRRDEDRHQRLVGTSADDPYAQARVRSSTGGVKLGPGAAAQAAVLNAAALEGPAPIRCELCQANFRNEAMLRQHEEGPAHKKALARDKARRDRESWMENPSAAANALQAAAWLNGEGMGSRHATARGGHRHGHQGAGRPGVPQQAAEQAVKSRGPSHAELIAQARKATEPISINGWVPPSLDLSAAQPPAEEPPSEAAAPPAEAPASPKHAEEDEDDEKAEQPSGAGAGLGLVDYDDESDGGDSDSGRSSGEPPPRKFDSFF